MLDLFYSPSFMLQSIDPDIKKKSWRILIITIVKIILSLLSVAFLIAVMLQLREFFSKNDNEKLEVFHRLSSNSNDNNNNEFPVEESEFPVFPVSTMATVITTTENTLDKNNSGIMTTELVATGRKLENSGDELKCQVMQTSADTKDELDRFENVMYLNLELWLYVMVFVSITSCSGILLFILGRFVAVDEISWKCVSGMYNFFQCIIILHSFFLGSRYVIILSRGIYDIPRACLFRGTYENASTSVTIGGILTVVNAVFHLIAAFFPGPHPLRYLPDDDTEEVVQTQQVPDDKDLKESKIDDGGVEALNDEIVSSVGQPESTISDSVS